MKWCERLRDQRELIRVKGGRKLLSNLMEKYVREVYEYNEKLPKGVRLKLVHYVTSKGKRYVYIGKYFYKYERVGGRIKWKYLGKEPPEGCPPPPKFPLDGFNARVEGNDLIVSEEVFERYLKESMDDQQSGSRRTLF